ncbi:MAG: SpoIIE family protein phosphatase [Clostridia bacterium]|nr:SpoIIE family protein phosphatase [Clostridia bacterium]
MKEVKALSAGGKIGRADITAAVIYHALSAVLGFILCRTVFFEKYTPFGVAFAAGCPSAYLPGAAAGVFLGYLLSLSSVTGFRYVVAAFAVFSIRFILSFYKKLDRSPPFAGLISFLSVALTGAATLSGIKADLLFLALEAVVCAVSSAVICRVSSFINRIYKGLTGEELGCLLIVISMVLSGIYGISAFGINLSVIVAVALILSVSKYGGTLAGTVGAISVSTLFFFAGQNTDICFAFTVCALAAGLVASYGKYVQLCAFFVCGAVFAVIWGPAAKSAAFIAEIILGCIAFAFIPKNAGIYLGKIFTCFPDISVNNDLNLAVTMRLSEAAAGIKDVKLTVDEVAARLEGINTPGFQSVLGRIEGEACAGCKMRNHCWQAQREGTLNAVFSVIKQIKAEGAAGQKSLPEDFKGRCIRSEKFQNAVNKNYLKYASVVAANSRISAIRQAVTDQFEGVAGMLDELADEYSSDWRFDNSAAVTAVTALKNIGVCADQCSAPVDKYGRMKINLRLIKSSDTVLNKRDIMRVISLACERDFAPPVIKKASGETFISISERPCLKVDIGICQKSAGDGELCGDAYSSFFDGKGHFIMILSDGMGTGGRAAVDSAMAAGLMGRLIKSGFGFDCALRILNCSMLFKSADESLATMDIASIDLHTGNVELYKAGAAPTVVRRQRRTGKAVSTSMPIGILSDVSFDRAGIKLFAGDIIVLISDGAAFDGTDWIRDELERFSSGSAQELADRLCLCAARRRSDGHTDDITVMAAVISKT